MENLRPDSEPRNPVVVALAMMLGDAIVIAAERPDVIAATRKLLGIEEKPVPEADPARLLTKAELARALRKSTSTIDRLDREGAPHSFVGDSKRYRLAETFEWLAVRGRKPTRELRAAEREVDIDDVLTSNGLRERSA